MANINTLYNANGVKLKKTNTRTTRISGSSTITDTTDYLDGFQYLETTTSGKRGILDGVIGETELALEREAFTVAAKPIILPPADTTSNAVLQFVPTAEGFYDFVENKYIYHYKDHLGNTRLSYAWNTTTNSIDVLDQNDYYPFGMNHLDSNSGSFFGESSYKNYKYNGKELQETGMYDYGARMYMPDIGRWGVVDPLAEKARRFSPYTYASDDPIGRLDPDGRFDSWFGALMHKTFNGHWGSKVQKNDNEKSANQGKYYYSYDSSKKSGSTTSTENGQKVTNIAEVSKTVVYNTKQEKTTVAALRNTAEKLDYIAVAADVTAVALTPTTLGTGTAVAETVAITASATSVALESYADLLEGHGKTALTRVLFYGVTFGVSKKIQSWEKVVGKTSATIMKAGNMGYDKTLDDATEDYDKKTYPKELKPEDY